MSGQSSVVMLAFEISNEYEIMNNEWLT